MMSEASGYTTRELSMKTWSDFQRLFMKHGMVGDGWWCWCTFHHASSTSSTENKQSDTRAQRAVRNRRMKRGLVGKGCAHGILVYARGEPVGWCQYGSSCELPHMYNATKYRKLNLGESRDVLWRITCFVVDKDYRLRGVASTGLKASLKSIRKKGGGIVEAYPVSETDQGSNYMYCGTVSMFEKAGFKIIAPLGTGRTKTVLMRTAV